MALVMVILTMLLVMAVGAALILTTSSEVLIAANFLESRQALYAADAAAEWALVDLTAVVDDWPTLLNTAVTSWFVDGPPNGWRALSDGSLFDLGALVQQNVPWKPYAFGRLDDLLPPPVEAEARGLSPGFYLLVSVAADAVAPERLKVRAEAVGPRGAHKTIEMSVLRDAAGVRPASWTERR
jgi:hypothetical protein